MKTNLLKAFLALVMLLVAAAGAPQRQPERALAAADGFHSSPVMFVENAGQWDSRARFQLWGGATTTWLTDDAIWLTVVDHEPDGEAHAANLRLSFAGASPNPRLEPFDRLDTTISYLIGSDPDQWRAAVPVWGGVRYAGLYPGIDLVAAQAGGRLALRLEAQPGADLNRVQLRVEGADAVHVDAGSLYMETPAGAAALPLLSSEQLTGEAIVQPLGEGAFAIAAPFTVDNPAAAPASAGPTADNPADLLIGTFIGGSDYDNGWDIQVNSAGQAFVTGTAGVNGVTGFPTTPGAYDPTSNGGDYDAFVAKVAADGASLIYATFLGGSGNEAGVRLALDAAGNAFVTGYTNSGNFPTTPGAHRITWNNTKDGFVTKLNPSGSALVYSTFIGGTNEFNEGHRIAIDASGNAYVAGSTLSSNLPVTPGAYDATFNGDTDAFVLKLNPPGTALLYSTYLGGSGADNGWGIAVGGGSDIFVSGYTTSANYPTTPGAWDRTPGGNEDAFVARFHPAGNGGADLVYSTYLGGSYNDEPYGLAANTAGTAYVVGWTQSPDFPTTPGAYDRRPLISYSQAFITRLNTSGTDLTYSTLLGGGGSDTAYDLALDAAGNIYVAGYTTSDDFPTTPGAFQEADPDPSYSGDAFVVKLRPDSSGVADLIYSSYLGGNNARDEANAIAVDASGKVYLTGWTAANNFPTTPGAFDRTFNGGMDAFVVKLGLANSAPLTCYPLTRSHTGQGTNPATFPNRTSGCPNGQFSPGQWIALTANPASGWQVKDWSGTDNNGSTATYNSATMPAGPHTVRVNYEPAPAATNKLFIPIILKGN